MKVRDLVSRKKLFVGRTQLLAKMKLLLIDSEENWSLLHIHGTIGIGKTALLRHFQEMHSSIPIIYLDSRHVVGGIQAFEDALQIQLMSFVLENEKHANQNMGVLLNTLIERHRRVIVLLDGLGSLEWEPIETWLREDWLPQLPINVRVCTAGRAALTNWVTTSGWENMIVHIPLKPLKKIEWVLFLESNGIHNHRLQDVIGRISSGIPLLMIFAMNLIPQEKNVDSYRSSDYRDLMEDMAQRLLLSCDLDASERMLLSVASISYDFDQELLEQVVGQQIHIEQFLRLCRSAFVQIHDQGGWIVVDGIRQLLRSDIKHRLPGKYEIYKQKIGDIYDRRTARGTGTLLQRNTHLNYSKLMFEDDDFIDSFVSFGRDKGYEARTAMKEEIPIIKTIYERMVAESPPYTVDDSRQQDYLDELWEVAPETVQVILCEERLIGFATPILLNLDTRAILLRNPATREFVTRTDHIENDYLLWILGVDPPMDQETLAFIVRKIFFPNLHGKRNTMMIWIPEAIASTHFLQAVSLPWADYQTASGLHFRFFQMDYRSQNIEPTEQKRVQEMTNTSAQYTDLVKKILIQLNDMDRCIPLLLHYEKISSQAAITYQSMKERILDTIHEEKKRLYGGRHADVIQAQILEYAFIKKIGPHHAVASFLGLSQATYYRYLKKLVTHLAQKLNM